eukprot:763142-Hanusia_phi.AAC.2
MTVPNSRTNNTIYNRVSMQSRVIAVQFLIPVLSCAFLSPLLSAARLLPRPCPSSTTGAETDDVAGPSPQWTHRHGGVCDDECNSGRRNQTMARLPEQEGGLGCG